MHKKNKRNELLSLIPPETAKILDLGCGGGSLSAGLKDNGVEVVGIERDERLCGEAKEKLDRVFTADVETIELPYPQDYFDIILCADILEHLLEPAAFLKKYRAYLKTGGFLIASIPNVRYYKIIIRLIFGGTWDYVEKGILDRGHLRFFTLINIEELFAESGYEILKIKRNIVASRGFRVLNLFLFGCLKNFITYQYYIKATKVSSGTEPFIRKRKVYQF